MEIGHYIPLEAMNVAAPCDADWGAMKGDDKARFCQSCEKHVYNLSGMTREEAEILINGYEGKMCIRLSRRADGTVITDNCPVGLRRARAAAQNASRVVVRPMRWGFSLLIMLLSPLILVAATTWMKAGGSHTCATSWQAFEKRLLSGELIGGKVQTVFGASNNALTTG